MLEQHTLCRQAACLCVERTRERARAEEGFSTGAQHSRVGLRRRVRRVGCVPYGVEGWSLCVALGSVCVVFAQKEHTRLSYRSMRRQSWPMLYSLCSTQHRRVLHMTHRSGVYTQIFPRQPNLSCVQNNGTPNMLLKCMLHIISFTERPVEYTKKRNKSTNDTTTPKAPLRCESVENMLVGVSNHHRAPTQPSSRHRGGKQNGIRSMLC